MDKQRIERAVSVASEHVKWAGWEQWAELSLVELVTRCVDIIDAERGKSAVAWMNERNGFICKEKTRDYHVPLFLSPTIPEGMALVPKSAMLWLNGEGDDFEQDRPGKFWWRSKFRELLAAAQGERNAD